MAVTHSLSRYLDLYGHLPGEHTFTRCAAERHFELPGRIHPGLSGNARGATPREQRGRSACGLWEDMYHA